jgi:anti-sigma factor RsiW
MAIAAGWRYTKALWRRAADAIRRLARPRRPKVVPLEAATEITSHAEGSLSVEPGATLAAKVEFLLRREKELQGRLDGLDKTLQGLPERWTAQIEKHRETLRKEQDQKLDRHLPVRRFGITLLAAGIVLATWGNLI